MSNSRKLGNSKRDIKKLFQMYKRCLKNYHADIRDGDADSEDEKNEVDAHCASTSFFSLHCTGVDRITGKT